jgi:NhaA family Na+:H+ antiporter
MAGSKRSLGSIELRAAQERVAREVHLPVQDFIRTEWIGSGVLLAAAVLALALANSPWAEAFHRLWEVTITLDVGLVAISKSLHHWINDGLMALFFFLVGLEIKRELLHGHLSDPRKAALPAFAALGGMVGPALLYAALNAGTAGARGWGIPMATDIAFALGVLGLLGRSIPGQLRVFLLALAIVDDLGAILVIAIFYTEHIVPGAFLVGAGALAVVLAMRWLGVRSTAAYILPGFIFWVAILKSGVHATIAGVVLALMTPSRHYYDDKTTIDLGRELLERFERAVERDDHDDAEATLGQMEVLVVGTESPLERLERTIHPWTAFLVLPIFALANAGVAVSGAVLAEAARSPVALGIVGGLIVGKMVGIVGFSWLAVKLGFADLPDGVVWMHVVGVSLLAGIGFTVSLFITELAFADPQLVAMAKVGILGASATAGVFGFFLLKLAVRRAPTETEA